uniref:Uncharacterized protein n=1 Tax=Myoviridae sp. ctx322 TaxID=2826711 RepID=A0A8S5NAV2_9CAUD|nr:MAG TPA: hypothetical protein [Myoviridae sp. ctx322]
MLYLPISHRKKLLQLADTYYEQMKKAYSKK